MLRGGGTISNTVMRLFALGSNRSFEEWLHALEQVRASLCGLNTATEKAFLDVGEKLQDFYRQSKEISELFSSIAGLLSGEEVTGVIDRLDEMARWIKTVEEESRQSTEGLRLILETLQAIQNQVFEFKRFVKTLHILGISTKIETARLHHDDVGFYDLVQEIKRLTLEIQSKSEDILNHSDSLARLIRKTLSEVAGLESRRHGHARALLEKTMDHISSLTDRYKRSSVTAAQSSRRYEEISKSIGEVVSSIQFHDITRQKIEHVSETIEQLADRIEAASLRRGRSRSDEASSVLASAGKVCELQTIQLSHAKEEFVEAVNRIIRSLQRISGEASSMVDENREMSGTADQASHSFFSGIERGLGSVQSILSEYALTTRTLSFAIHQIVSTTGELAAFVKDIERIGIYIERIALNACVKAAHLGEEGLTLGVLSEAIQQLSVEARQKTASVTESLQSITSAGRAITLGSDLQSEGEENQIDQKDRGLEASIGDLRQLNERILSLSKVMKENGEALSVEIERTLSGVDVHERAAEVIEQAVLKLGKIILSSRSNAPAAGEQEEKNGLEGLEGQYTMNSEREAHRSFVSSEGNRWLKVQGDLSGDEGVKGVDPEGKDLEVQPTPSKAGSEDLGENVELF
jgi:hypothetical protein